MLNEEELEKVAFHGRIHDMGMCNCPCYDAILKVGKAIKEERELMAKVGEVSPMALAALIGSDLAKLPDDYDDD